MDLKQLKGREVGLFSKKIYCGMFFAEKQLCDFKTEKEYKAYLEAENKNVFILMREPNSTESKDLTGNRIPEAVVDKLPAAEQVKFYETKVKQDDDRGDKIMALAKQCIIGSNITSDGALAKVEEVRDICFQSTGLMGHLITEWMETSVNFQNKSEEK